MHEATHLLFLTNVKKYFGAVRAVDGVSFQIGQGEIVGVVGPNGSGKTTLINLISGELIPDGGRIRFKDFDITLTPIHKRVKLGIARSYQLPQIFERLSVLENVLAGLLSYNGHALDFWSLKSSKKALIKRAEEILDALGLLNKATVEARKLSEGERKILDVAMALTLNPKLLLLDEPTTSVSLEEKDMVMSVLMKYIKQHGISSVIVEHDLEVVEKYLPSRILVMNEGKVIYNGEFQGIRLDERVRAVVFGE